MKGAELAIFNSENAEGSAAFSAEPGPNVKSASEKTKYVSSFDWVGGESDVADGESVVENENKGETGFADVTVGESSKFETGLGVKLEFTESIWVGKIDGALLGEKLDAVGDGLSTLSGLFDGLRD